MNTSTADHAYTPLWSNFITMTGMFLVAAALIALLTFGLFTLVTPHTNPYADIVGYLVVPCVLILGVVIIPFGILLRSWRLHRKDPAQRLTFRFPQIDLNDPNQRKAAKIVVLATFILLPVVGFSGYHGYHYTDSATFCSKACHTAMRPQATTYEHSAHARVACAECHIGTGASWFVRSKLSGTRQVLAMWRNTFSRPIPPAIQHLRPARETCERCHWPKKFFGAQLREIARFSSDEHNTRRNISMLLKTGGGDETIGRAEGIHMHMTLAGRIDYVATDDKLQVIPWVRYIDQAGNESIYRSDGRPSSDPRPTGKVRTLDCMDCHNRPAHKFRSPQDAVDIFLETGRIDTTIPFIKREAVNALVRPYPDLATAERQIANHLIEFYRTDYPDVWDTRKASVNYAIDMVREIYRRSFFPAMKVDWRTYPDNIGHLISPGCFRCHEGKHVNQRGKPISHECDVCHTFLNPAADQSGTAILRQGNFVHPLTLEGPHRELRCDQCHTGGKAPLPTCEGCHTAQSEFRAGTLDIFAPFSIHADPMAATVTCDGCHDPSNPSNMETINAACMDCHDDEPERFEGMAASWKKEVEELLKLADDHADERTQQLVRALRQAGPLHNIEAAKLILNTLATRPPQGAAQLDHPQGDEEDYHKPPE
ncbi:MAG: cytochrome c3 family protein [Phycisphaerae bacterium]